MPNLQERQIVFLKILLLVIVCVYFAKNATEQINYSPVKKDAMQILAMALNAYNHGVVSKSYTEKDILPTAYREPGYPLFMSLGMSVILERNELDVTEALESTTTETRSKVNELKYLNVVILIAIALLSFAATNLFTRNYIISLLALVMVGNNQILKENVNLFINENFAALLILLTGFAFALTQLKNNRRCYYFTLGLILSVLTLTKAMFFYFFPVGLLFLLYSAKRQKLPKRSALKNISLFALGFLVFTLFWIGRNYYHFDRFFLTQRGGRILAVRSAYDTMSVREYFASFLYWTPNDKAKKILSKYFTKEDYQNLDRDNINGYRHIMRHRQHFLLKLHNDSVLVDKILLEQAKSEMLKNPVKHLLTTIPFAYRGIFVTPRLYLFDDFYIIKGTYLCFILFFCLFMVTIGSLIERDLPLFTFFFPAVFSYSFYSLFSHNIPRYNTALIPVLWVATILFIYNYALKYATASAAKVRRLLLRGSRRNE